MYSEHLIASVLPYATATYRFGDQLDLDVTRVVVTLGRLIGRSVNTLPTDASLAWWSARSGTPVPIGTRGAIHVLYDGRCALGLGPGRGVLETAGDTLAVVTHPEPTRYTGAWRIPTIDYGGLI